MKSSYMQTIKKYGALPRSFPYILIGFGAAGFLASAAINIEKTHLLKNPNTDLACNLNPVYSCGSVIMTKQSEVFGFSNELMGLGMFAALVTLGVVLLAGGKLKPWLWRIFLAGMVGSMVFVAWFFNQSVYNINALCIFCSIVWVSTWSITAAGFAWMHDQKMLPVLHGRLGAAMRWKRRRIIYIWAAVLLFGAGLILHHFWYYYGQYFGY